MAQQLRTYETICITKVDMPDDKYNTLLESVKSAITGEGKGEVIYTDDWGRAKIAYTIGKDNRGRWTYFRFKAGGDGINEIRRRLSINEFVLRYLTTKANEDGSDYDSLRQNLPKELLDRENTRDWKEERGGYRGRGGGGGYQGRRDYGSRDDYGSDGGDDGDMIFDETGAGSMPQRGGGGGGGNQDRDADRGDRGDRGNNDRPN